MFIFSAGCDRSEPDPKPPEYELVIPDDVPEFVIVSDKVGDKQHEYSGREAYAGGYDLGWKECWQEHLREKAEPRGKRVGHLAVPQMFGIQARGFEDGFKACERHLLEER